jgi:hypothetical protein
MPTPVLGNALLSDRAATLAAVLNASHKLKLFANSLTPNPATPLASFVEATFAGYQGVALDSQFGAPTKVQDGQYQISTPFFTFTCSGGSGQLVYGWYIDDSVNMRLAQAFDTPVTIAPGSPYMLQIQPQEISQSIL